jgi:tetratricopeptide (TPR) repeat protein
MSKHCQLIELRLALDHLITYGSKRAAMALARKSLALAVSRSLPQEIAYFTGQKEFLNGRFASAMEHFDEALRLNPADGAAYNDRALCMAELGMLDGALSDFDRGIAAEPDFATIHHNKGWLLNNLGLHTEAIACFRTALSLEEGRAVTYDNLADALYNLGDYAGALAAYRRVLELLAPGECRHIRPMIRRQIASLEKRLHNKET